MQRRNNAGLFAETLPEPHRDLSIVEAAELSRLLEEKWGVAASGPTSVAGLPAKPQSTVEKAIRGEYESVGLPNYVSENLAQNVERQVLEYFRSTIIGAINIKYNLEHVDFMPHSETMGFSVSGGLRLFDDIKTTAKVDIGDEGDVLKPRYSANFESNFLNIYEIRDLYLKYSGNLLHNTEVELVDSIKNFLRLEFGAASVDDRLAETIANLIADHQALQALVADKRGASQLVGVPHHGTIPLNEHTLVEPGRAKAGREGKEIPKDLADKIAGLRPYEAHKFFVEWIAVNNTIPKYAAALEADKSLNPSRYYDTTWKAFADAGVLYRDDLKAIDANLERRLAQYNYNHGRKQPVAMPPDASVRDDRIVATAEKNSLEYKDSDARVRARHRIAQRRNASSDPN